MNALLQTHELVKTYGALTAVDHVSVNVFPGETVAIIGPNGAGKSTLIELVLGLRQAEAGSVEFASPALRRRVGVQLQTTPLFPGLNALDNLRLVAAFYSVRLDVPQAIVLLERCRLKDAAHTDVVRLSGGQRKRLAIAMALVNSPLLIVLDEPTAALDPRAAQEVRELVTTLAAQGCGVVFTSHDMTEVAHMADRIILIEHGQVRADGPPGLLLREHGASSLEQLYLGLTQT